ncbi:lipase [Tsukamurella sp. 8F]|uniref:esterase/lipase family protein n=1 Tax=unclassified Tsukamurella TaxID=2633480 RepID=UPI0023B91BB5|nr:MULTISPECIES: lipase [unclassified Tsukamurella]MDF0529319.1 lipase [Tsukamurella sp. 8J]MDF0587174.1 lipase [Tsukamurella sp. 8F]
MKTLPKLASAVACVAAAGSLAIAPVQAAPATGPVKDVVIVPGQTFGSLPYTPLKDSLEQSGYRVTVLSTEGTNLPADARVIAGTVDGIRKAHPKDGIALVGHSVGGLSARYYLKELGGASKVKTYVAIGTPQYGNPAGCTQSGTAHDVCPTTPFMKALNGGVNAVGSTQYYSIRSSKEWVDGRLTGRQCRMAPISSITSKGDIDHIIEPLDPRVAAQVKAALAGNCQGQTVTAPVGSINVNQTLYPGGR